MFDRLLGFGSTFDWITPVVALVRDVVNGPSRTLLVPDDCGWSGREIIRLLRRHGIRSWGHMIVNNTLMLTVRLAQADYAEYLLERAGIPLENATRIDRHHGQANDLPPNGVISSLRELGNHRLF